MRFLLISLVYLSVLKGNAQDSAVVKPLHFSGYMEAYYCFDLAQPASHERPFFFYNYVRHNEVALNLGLIKAAYTTERIRSNFTIMMGTYAQYNLYYEEELLKHVYEANAGFKISKKKNVWIDAGILPSHIGAESAVGKDNWTLTRSLPSEGSPFYEAGIKISTTNKNDKWHFAAMYLNGWQRMQRIPNNQTPAFGTQISCKPSGKLFINWSTYAGNEFPDSMRQWRYFSNSYAQWNPVSKLGILMGFDIGVQQKSKFSKAYDTWYSPSIILQYRPWEKIRIAARGEYYADENCVIIYYNTPHGFKVTAYSLGIDYLPVGHAMLRLEARMLNSVDKIFTLNNEPSSQNYFFTTSLSIAF